MKILIVDGNNSMRALLRDLVLNITTDISEASTGLEAVERNDRDHPAYVLMDIRMPDMDGIEVIKRIHRNSPAGVIVIVTEDDLPSCRRDARIAGAKDFILKERLHELVPRLTNLMHVH